MTASGEPRRRPRRTAPLVAGVAVLVGATAALAVTPLLGDDRPVPPGVAARPTEPPAVAGSAGTVGAGGCLAELADVVSAGSPEPVKAGRYTFVHARWWGEDSSYSETTGSTQTMSTYESKRYRAADGSGRDYVIAIPGESTRADEVSHYGRGGLAGVLPEPIPTSPSVLAAQLAVHAGPPEDQPRGLMRAAADLYRLHLLERDARVAVLRMLAAHTPPVECAGTVLDRAGRTGIAVAVTFGISRYTLVFDPATGGLLADEQMLLRNPPALSGPVPRVISYWLFLAADRTDQLPA